MKRRDQLSLYGENPLSKATFVVEFEDGCPAVGAGTEILGGKLVAVQFSDALEELNELLEANSDG